MIQAFYEKGKGDIDLHFAAMDALSEIGKPAVDALVELISRNESDEISKSAVRALGRIQDDRSVECLNRVIVNYEYIWICRCSAVQHLANIGDKRCVEPILKAIGDKQYDTFFLGTLEKFADSRAIPVLEAALLDDKGSGMKSQITEILSRLKGTTPKWAMALKVGERDHLKIAQAFIDGELTKDAPDFESLRRTLEPFRGGEKNGAWLNVGYAFKTQRKDERTAAQCFAEGLGHFPEERIVSWQHIVIPANAPDAMELQRRLGACYEEGTARSVRVETVAKLKELFGAPGT